MEIYLVRHTKVAISREYCYGISDVDLAESWKEDVSEVKHKLNGRRFDFAYTSPLKRCQILSDHLVNHADQQDALLEMDLGDWELQKWDDLDQDYLNRWMADFVHIAPPKTENFLEYSMKPVLFFDQLINTREHQDSILLVSHSGAIRAIICHVLNLPLANAFHFEIDYGSVSKIEVTDKWAKVRYLNH